MAAKSHLPHVSLLGSMVQGTASHNLAGYPLLSESKKEGGGWEEMT